MRFLILGIVCLSLFSCKKDDSADGDTSTVISGELNVVTGITVRANFGDPSITYGNPNNFAEKMVLYPNPVVSTLSLKTSSKMTNVWIVSATPQLKDQDVDFSKILNSNSFKEEEIISKSVFKEEFDFKESSEQAVIEEGSLSVDEFNPELNKEISLDVRELNAGYYKIFIKIDNDLFWDIFQVPNDNDTLETLKNFWKKVSK